MTESYIERVKREVRENQERTGYVPEDFYAQLMAAERARTDMKKEYPFTMDMVDENIRPLILAMNRLDWIATISCCEGHEDNVHHVHENPYVAFAYKTSHLPELLGIVERIQAFFSEDKILIELSFVTDRRVNGCQLEMNKGWLSLNLSIGIYEEAFEAWKMVVLDRLTAEFS